MLLKQVPSFWHFGKSASLECKSDVSAKRKLASACLEN